MARLRRAAGDTTMAPGKAGGHSRVPQLCGQSLSPADRKAWQQALALLLGLKADPRRGAATASFCPSAISTFSESAYIRRVVMLHMRESAARCV